MFDLLSFIIGACVGGSVGIAAMALLHGGGQIDDEPEYWVNKLGRRSGDK